MSASTRLRCRVQAASGLARVPRRELLFGSPEFRAASELVRTLPPTRRGAAVVSSVLRDPTLIRAAVAVWRLPTLELRLPADQVGAWSLYHGGPVGRRWARAVLALPTAEEGYLAGRPRQALRTNLRHARRRGVTSDRVDTYDAWHAAAGAVLDGRDDGPVAALDIDQPWHGQAAAYYLARDADATPLAFARVALFGHFGVLAYMLSHHGRLNATWARYQLHTFAALDLGASGVEYLLVGSALREPEGNAYFQHLLGYQPRNLRVEVVASRPR